MATNAKALSEQLRQAVKDKSGGIFANYTEDVHKAVADFLYNSLMRTTKVKTGELIGGWTFTGHSTKGRLNKFRLTPPNEVVALANSKGAEITISNNVVYAAVQATDSVHLSFAELMAFAALKGIKVKVL
jgi:hypothetical protein